MYISQDVLHKACQFQTKLLAYLSIFPFFVNTQENFEGVGDKRKKILYNPAYIHSE